ncbi:competence type IV pilus major pilin ComGC [Hespellia stercorisuis]|uniref:Prepilin-type N-terminal cleavage/methylation domain-containing protein n=1 Tax=Hespellia stercorisuis DSM 15480 TaxID=1121950 RepID=A0A1M6R2S1_9FIRM|nr:prepilin-type N-terminal cleavage/methylation domain-containing protein [Hespellia stercorisuis]SHK26723.1 prepilin-type N-terminal cleavage/methylation domain-containing protein [Hespellia stercorisuis DSM 15480]
MKQREKNQGFTLAELLIVIAIIAVLVAVSIPLFTNRLKKAREATCAANCKTLQRHIVAELLDEKDAGETPETLLPVMIEKDDAKCPSEGVFSISPSGATLETGFKVVCSKHGSVPSFGDATQREKILQILSEAKNGDKLVSRVDSGAAELPSAAKEAVATLKKAGFDFEKMGAKSWSYVRGKSEGEAFLYWSTEDISDREPGTTVPVMRYNQKTGTYTVWIATVTKKTEDTVGTYNVYDSYAGYGESINQSKDKQTYENMLQFYEKALKEQASKEQ